MCCFLREKSDKILKSICTFKTKNKFLSVSLEELLRQKNQDNYFNINFKRERFVRVYQGILKKKDSTLYDAR